MSEIRKDITTGRLSVYAPERSCRPRELPIPSSERSPEPEERADLADLLKDVLTRLDGTLERPDYNLMLVSQVNRSDPADDIHWYLSIHPRLITLGGFEIGAGMIINPSLPERDAELLRDQT